MTPRAHDSTLVRGTGPAPVSPGRSDSSRSGSPETTGGCTGRWKPPGQGRGQGVATGTPQRPPANLLGLPSGSPARGRRQLCEAKDINVAVVAPGVDVGLAPVPMHRQALDRLAVALRRRQTRRGEVGTRPPAWGLPHSADRAWAGGRSGRPPASCRVPSPRSPTGPEHLPPGPVRFPH